MKISTCKWGIYSYIILILVSIISVYVDCVTVSISWCYCRLLSFSILDWRLKLYFQNCIALFILYCLLYTRDKIHNILGAYIEMAECHNVSQSMPAERLPPCCCI
jgi:hypothetical protein